MKNKSYDNIKSHKKPGLLPVALSLSLGNTVLKKTQGGSYWPPNIFRVDEGKNRVPMPPKTPLKSFKKLKLSYKILKSPKILAYHSDIS